MRSRAIWPLQRPTSNCSNCPLRLRRSTVNMAGRTLSGSLLPLYGGWAGEHRGSYQSAPPRLPDPEPVRPQGPAGAAAPTSCGPASRVLRGRIPGFSRNPTLPLRTRAWATTRGSLASHARPGAAVTERRRPLDPHHPDQQLHPARPTRTTAPSSASHSTRAAEDVSSSRHSDGRPSPGSSQGPVRGRRSALDP